MNAHTKSGQLIKLETLVLNNLIDIFIQNGPSITPERAATVLIMLKNHTGSLQAPEGRKLFLIAKTLIKGTEWENIVFPKPRSQEEIRWQKLVDDLEDEYLKKLKDKGILIANVLYGPSEDQIKNKCDEFYSKYISL